jgi:tRNA-splicing ligase RtcB
LMIGGGTDENPFAYKNIETVMASQVSLVDVLGTYKTSVCRMAND